MSTSESSLSGDSIALKARAIAAIAAPSPGGARSHADGGGRRATSTYDAIVASGRQPIFAFWHGRILGGLYYFRDRGIVVITSQNFDGEWIARIIERFGFGTARGSTSRGGARALVQLRRDLAAGRPVGFTVDGPRGPARVAQPGAVWLAGATGHPILPFHVEADRFWEAPSWDRTQVPKPFATVAVVDRRRRSSCRMRPKRQSKTKRRELGADAGDARRPGPRRC